MFYLLYSYSTHIIQDAHLSQKDRAAGCVIILAKSGRLEPGDDSLRTLRSIFKKCDIIGLKIYRIRSMTQNKGYFYGVQVHSRSSRSIPIESPYETSLVINSNWYPISYPFGVTVQFWSLCIFEPPFFWGGGLRNNVRCSPWAHWKARSGLPISVNWTFLLGVTAESLRAKRDRKSAISHQHGQFDPKFQVEGVAPTNHFCTLIVRPMNALQPCRWYFSHKETS